jgi:hypothetical protein
MALSDLEAEVQLESEERASKILSTEMEERGRAEVFVRGTEETGMLCTVMHRHTEAEALCDTMHLVGCSSVVCPVDEVRTLFGKQSAGKLADLERDVERFGGVQKVER